MLVASSVCTKAANTKIVASGKIVSKEIKGIAGFKEIQTNNVVDVIYHSAADTRIVVSASDNVIPYIEVAKNGSRLEVGLKKGINVRVKNSRADLKVNVYAPSVSAFAVKGSGDIRIATDLKADRLALGVSGSGDIDAYNLTAGEVALGITGSGDIDVRGIKGKKIAIGITGSGDVEVRSVNADNLNCGLSGSGDIVVAAGAVKSANYGSTGSGDIKAGNVRADEANAAASGSGNISCRTNGQLTTAATGSGEIFYYGNPEKVVGKNKRVKARR